MQPLHVGGRGYQPAISEGRPRHGGSRACRHYTSKVGRINRRAGTTDGMRQRFTLPMHGRSELRRAELRTRQVSNECAPQLPGSVGRSRVSPAMLVPLVQPRLVLRRKTNSDRRRGGPEVFRTRLDPIGATPDRGVAHRAASECLRPQGTTSPLPSCTQGRSWRGRCEEQPTTIGTSLRHFDRAATVLSAAPSCVAGSPLEWIGDPA